MNIVIFGGIVLTMLTCVPVMLQLRGHPRGLYVLFFAEMWERFSFYGMRAILVLYLTKHFLFSDNAANGQYGAYQSLAYLLPLMGGVLADRYIGTRRAVAFGALLMVVGQLTMAVQGPDARQILNYHGHAYSFVAQGVGTARHARLQIGANLYDYGPSAGGGLAIRGLPGGAPIPSVLSVGDFTLSVVGQESRYLDFMYFAMSMTIVGIGFLKANISSIVGQLYAASDVKRDAGFTLYYFGINLGSFWASLLCGYLGETVGWWAGFGLAGLGMLAGFIVFVLGRSWLGGHGEPHDLQRLERRIVGPINREGLIYAGGLAAVGLVFMVVRHNAWVGWILGAASIAVIAYVGNYMLRRADRVERQRLLLALVLIMGSVFYFTLFEQAGSSLQTFADRNVDLNLIAHPTRFRLFGHEVFMGSRAMLEAVPAQANRWWLDMSFSASQTQAFNPGFILMFAPVFAGLWSFLGRRRRDPDPAVKFGLALLQIGVAFLILVWSARYADGAFRTPLLFLALSNLLQTTGELCLSPVGMSQITKLSPAILLSTLMACWFLSLSWAEWLGGVIAQLAGSETVAGVVLDPAKALASSVRVFGALGWVTIVAGAMFLGASPVLRKWSHGVNDGPSPVAPEPFAPTVDADRQAVNPMVLRAERDR